MLVETSNIKPKNLRNFMMSHTNLYHLSKSCKYPIFLELNIYIYIYTYIYLWTVEVSSSSDEHQATSVTGA